MRFWRALLVAAFWMPAAAMLARPAMASTFAPDQAAGTWVWGGSATLSFNPDALATLGVQVDNATAATARAPGVPGRRYDVTRFAALPASGLEILRKGAEIGGIGEGALRFQGGLILRHAGGRVDLRGFVLRANPLVRGGIELADANGATWFSADHAHYGFAADRSGAFAMRHMNLRLSAQFADALGRPQLAGYPVGDLSFEAAARADDVDDAKAGATCSAPWPAPNLRTDIQLTLANLSGFYDAVYAPRCGLPPLPDGGACGATSTNGKLVLGADASLRNAGQTAVPWHAHFSGDFAPYGNDQHPYLIWNLYRIDAAGRIRQIGASGVKHAFYSINLNCGCADGNVIWPGCEDVYSLSSNDNGGGTDEQNLAPRSEIVPHTGQWGRCGSVWDSDCNGAMDAGSGAQDLYQFRLQVEESDLLPPLSSGARYFFEYWYVVRDDSDLDDSMGYREILPAKHAAAWSIGLVGENAADRDFFQGPAINRWVDPNAPPASALNRELATPLGRARVAVKATALGDGRWRYEYAVMNLDYAHAEIDPAHATEPNLRLRSNHGFVRFGVPLPAGTNVTGLRFDGADGAAADDWIASSANGMLAWSAPATANALDWGTLYHFEFVADTAPTQATIALAGAPTASEGEQAYTLALLGPGVHATSLPTGHSRHARPTLGSGESLHLEGN
ncbi:MAG TPA: hypothetical protein VGC55_00055 [Dokdonella sp.]